MKKNGLQKWRRILLVMLKRQLPIYTSIKPMKYRKFPAKIRFATVLVLLFVLMSYINSYGAQTDNISEDTNKEEVIISSQWENKKKTSGKVFFLFSEARLSFSHGGNIILLFSKAVISSGFNGNIYSFLSEVNIESEAYVDGDIHTLSSLVTSIDKPFQIEAMAYWDDIFFDTEIENNVYIYDSRLPALVFLLVFCAARLIICMVIYGLKPGFFNQGSVLLNEDATDIIQFGLIAYTLTLASALVFFLSVAGIIFSFVILACGFLLSLLGQISLQMSLGSLLLQKFGLRNGPYIAIAVGGIILEGATLVPIIGLGANFVFFPILCLGVLATGFINGFYRRKFYATDFDETYNKEKLIDKETIIRIIKDGK